MYFTDGWKIVPSGFDLTKATKVLANYDNDTLKLKPYETRVYVLNK